MKHLHPLYSDIPRPERFTYPFCYEPHPLCQLAAKEVQAYIGSHEEIKEDADRGKMFGVLVVQSDLNNLNIQNTQNNLSFLAAYSGLLAGRNDWDYFVPPVYDAQQPDGHFKTTEREISEKVHHLTQGQSLCATSLTRGQSPCEMSQELQLWLFHQYQLLNARGETKDLVISILQESRRTTVTCSAWGQWILPSQFLAMVIRLPDIHQVLRLPSCV